VDLRAGLDAVVWREILPVLRNAPRLSLDIVRCFTDRALPALLLEHGVTAQTLESSCHEMTG
jgi:hypothetical protein